MRDYLVSLRAKRNESQQDVASAVGISRQYYDMIEKNTRQKKMDIVLVMAFAKHFDVPATTILTEEAKLHNVAS